MMRNSRYVGFYPFPAITLDSIYATPDGDSNAFYAYMSELLCDFVEAQYRLRATRDGLLHIHLMEIEPPVGGQRDSQLVAESTRVYFRYLNAFYLLLDCTLNVFDRTSLLFLEELSVRDLLIITYDQDDKFHAMTTLGLGYASYIEHARILSGLKGTQHPMMDERLSGRLFVAPSYVESANTLLSKVSANAEALFALSQLSKGLSEFNKGNYESSFALTWFAIERILSVWVRLCNGRRPAVDPHGKSVRKMTAELRRAGFPKTSVLDRIEQLRDVRNSIVHNYPETWTTSAECESAFSVVTDFLSYECGVDISLNTSRRLRMIG